MCVCVCVCVSHSVMSICAPMDCDPPASSVHGILQARVLEWAAVLFPTGSGWYNTNKELFDVCPRLLS